MALNEQMAKNTAAIKIPKNIDSVKPFPKPVVPSVANVPNGASVAAS
jgi:hypothetical protein